MPKEGGYVSDLGHIGSGSAILRFDIARKRLYWTTKGASKYDRVLSYSIEERKLTIMAEGEPIFGGMAHDEDYVYWVGKTAIMRLAK